ncbi:MAG: MBL fold metallo-hydrolase [Candidatus Eisenbacteria bacterium]|nr:MBL fold metallo-hydrolase [Candidatus Eisenbacteria bacterium]
MATDRPGLGNPEVVDFQNGVHAVLGMETVDGVHAANVGVITTPRTIVFVNSGQTEAQADFVWSLAQSRAPAREMLYLVLTHHHLDHCFAASFFDERHALIYAHRSFLECMAEMRKHLGAADYQEMLCAFLKIDADRCRRIVGPVHPVTPHRHVGEEVSLAINGEEVQILHLPGHARCELVVYHPRTRTLFAGDAVNEKAGPVTLFGDSKDWRRWVIGLERLRKLEIERIVPGHGKVCGPGVLDAHIETLEKRIAAAG